MASSVSSEWAFSGASITITKHCNRLKGDITEALQSLKCAFRHDLLICEAQPSAKLEEDILLKEDAKAALMDGLKVQEPEDGLVLELELDTDAKESDDES
jgi:hypothetical protein